MNLLVRLEIAQRGKLLGADLTLKRLVARVRSFVDFKIVLLCESLDAKAALVGFLAGMCSYMLC